ncbi:unnamed protein product [Thelazia callipaeda]|uniref:LIM/homeobox protein Lhx9 n=1 Tax=Thelazia callipaeda TaxID=103827 RepID=A0A0N5CQP9_THECL|nr:unnamed protein product [Thelazia callipaeda]
MNEQSWHYDCLRCCVCHCLLNATSTCYFKNGMIFCRNDYFSRYGKRCERCTSVLCREDMVMKANDAIFHVSCFTCCICAVPLRPGELFMMGCNGTLYCHSTEFPVIVMKDGYRKWSQAKDDIETATDKEALNTTNKSKRMRTSFKHHQLRTMKSYFNLNHNPDAKDLKQLAQRTGLTKRVLQKTPEISNVVFYNIYALTHIYIYIYISKL